MSRRRPTVARTFIYIQYKPFMWRCSDARLRHVNFFYLSRCRFRHPIGFQLFYWDFGRTTAWLPFYLTCRANLLFEWALLTAHGASCLHFIYLMSELSCEYIQSTHLACWFGQMLKKAILWMKSTIASLTSGGVPVSPVWSWSWSLVLYMLPLP